jgi:dihydrofolate synthase/folylpolyglutamate synthase
MRFATLADATAFVEGFATRPPTERDTLPLRERQAAHWPEMVALLTELGNPQDRLRVVHVTGTSGKGSTATMVAALLRAGGLRVGLYTNPYVISPQERVQIDGAFISAADFIASADSVAAALERMALRQPDWHPHLKQVWVALMLVAFDRARVDLAVVEVGMGGRFDETNVVHPIVAILTNVGFDHGEFLGPTLAEIAWHKAGIIKEGAAVITGITQPDLQAIVRRETERSGSPLALLHEDFEVTLTKIDAQGTHFTYQDQRGEIAGLCTPLVGAHQATNAALALRAARQILPDLSVDAIRSGFGAAWLPGRFEIVAQAPTVVLDVAHNPDKMGALVATLRATTQWQTLWVVFGALGSKEVGTMLATLAPLQPRLIATMPPVMGRLSQAAEAIAAQARANGIATVTTQPTPLQAVQFALDHAGPQDVIVVTGSLFLVSAVRGKWRP